MSRDRRRDRWLVAAALLVLAPACSDDRSDVEVGAPSEAAGEATGGEWLRHRLGPSAADRQIVSAPAGGGVVLLTVDESGDVRGHRLEADGTLEEASVEAERAESLVITAIAEGPNGLVATGNELHPDFENFVLTSADGLTWSKPATSGLDVPMDVFDLVATDDAYIAVGTLRTAEDPSQGGFVPAILRSADGTSWSRARTPSLEEGSIRSVAAVGSTVFAAGDIGGAPVLWRSTDGGQRWGSVEGAPPVSEVAASGATLLGAHSGGDVAGELALHRSDDGGASWQEIDAGFADGFNLTSFVGEPAGFAMVTTEAYRDAFSSPELCYADIELCGPRTSVDDGALLISPDGVEWGRLALDALDGLLGPSAVLHDRSGGTVVLGTTEDGEWGAWVWDATQGDPSAAAPPDEVPEYDGPPIVEHGADLEEGVRRAYPLYIHCGMDHLGEFNGTPWKLLEPSAGDRPETGAGDGVPEDWPVVGQSILGYVTRVSEDRIEYSLEDGEVIGVYGPLPDGAEVPGCA